MEGSSTFTNWKRRDSAGSRSTYFLYSDQVVAAIVRSSPRARAGFKRLAASLPPSLPPAPISVWASSIKRTIGVVLFFTKSITDFKRFSNSPLIDAPDCKAARSRLQSSTFCKCGGTCLLTMRNANPSINALLPTPASPTTIGLFFLLRERISIMRSISLSRARTGSILPAEALAVKFSAKRAKSDWSVCTAEGAAVFSCVVCDSAEPLANTSKDWRNVSLLI